MSEIIAEIVGDPIKAWTAIIGTLTLFMVWAGLRINHRNAQASAPHIVANIEGPERRRRVQFHLDGPNKDNWSVTKASLKWLSKNQLCRPMFGLQPDGVYEQTAAHPQGRSMRSPSSPLILAEPPSSDFDIVFTISLKSDPKIKRRCAARIELID